VSVANSTCKAVTSKIFSTRQAERVSTLSQNRRQKELEANGTGQNFLIDEGVNLSEMRSIDSRL